MATPGFALFDTTIGRCAIAWDERGLTGVQLPESHELETRARMHHRFPDARETSPPVEAAQAMDGIVRLLQGEPVDLSCIVLDMTGVPPFHRHVYEVARSIPPGKTLSYGEVATRLGASGSARAVGQALGRNPFAIVVPCHRVLAANGRPGGFSASGGVATKLLLLSIEGAVPIQGSLPLFEQEPALGFDPRTAVAYLRAADADLARAIDAVGPFRPTLKSTHSIFGALAEAIVYQQLSPKAAATIFGRLCALFPPADTLPEPAQILAAGDADLRGAGLSGSKVQSLRDLARRAADGGLPALSELREMTDDTIVARLTEVRGIGRWTAEMLLIFRLGRPDVLPLDDYALRKGLGVVLGRRSVPGARELARRGARWAPFRSVASWYLWRAAELGALPTRDAAGKLRQDNRPRDARV